MFNRYLIILIVVLGHCAYGKLELKFFGSNSCGQCLQIKEEVLKPLVGEFPDRLSIKYYDIENSDDNSLLLQLEKSYGITKPKPIELFFPDTVLLGGEDVLVNGDLLIREILADSSRWQNRYILNDALTKEGHKEELKSRLSSFSFGAIILAGLADGVNPCAIATIIFLISFLLNKKRSKREIISVGLLFTISVYTTYLLLGLGAFKIVMALESYRYFSSIIRYGAVGMALLIAIYSFYDAFLYFRSSDSKQIKLQLPNSVKKGIHHIISSKLSGQHLLFWTVIVGFLVTLLEAVCTGQVYLPTIVLIAKEGEFIGWIYLLVYNFLFVLPLIIIVILVNFGLTWQKLVKVSKGSLTAIKVLIGIVLLLMAILLWNTL